MNSAYLLTYLDLLRSDELINLKCSDVVFNMSLIIILSRMTDKYRDGTWILIAKKKIVQ